MRLKHERKKERTLAFDYIDCIEWFYEQLYLHAFVESKMWLIKIIRWLVIIRSLYFASLIVDNYICVTNDRFRKIFTTYLEDSLRLTRSPFVISLIMSLLENKHLTSIASFSFSLSISVDKIKLFIDLYFVRANHDLNKRRLINFLKTKLSLKMLRTRR